MPLSSRSLHRYVTSSPPRSLPRRDRAKQSNPPYFTSSKATRMYIPANGPKALSPRARPRLSQRPPARQPASPASSPRRIPTIQGFQTRTHALPRPVPYALPSGFLPMRRCRRRRRRPASIPRHDDVGALLWRNAMVLRCDVVRCDVM